MAWFGLKKDKEKAAPETDVAEAPAVAPEPIEPKPAPEAPEETTQPEKPKLGMFGKLKQRLAKTRSTLSEGVSNLFLGKKEIDEDLFEELETQLLLADIGVNTTQKIIDELTAKTKRKELADPQALYEHLKTLLADVIKNVDQPLVIEAEKKPYIILMVGVNGVGKTTTVGKLARRFRDEGRSVLLAAGDTFRAAAVEQLQVWGERNDIQVVAQHTGADSASVIFDAVEAARARGTDIVIADTAGRLHNKSNLMEELKKIKRVLAKIDNSAPHEIMLVVDAGNGQNALNQAEQFNEAIGLTGISVTKLDGTAKGGILFAIADKLNIPIRFIGVGEAVEDLRPFNAQEFIEALFDSSAQSNND